MRRLIPAVLVMSAALVLAGAAAAQNLQQDLAALAATPAVTGYEGALRAEIRARAPGYEWQQDNLGNLWTTVGAGAPHRLLVAPLDEPGYIVSAITADGFLRVQRLPQFAVHPLFDQLHAAQPVWVVARDGRRISGVVAGLSVHLQGGRRDAPRVTHPDEVYVDIGARTAAEAREAGVELLDPIALERVTYSLGFGKMTAPAIGDRYGAAALLELLRRLDRTKLRGTLTVAFAAQQWPGSRGLDRLTQHVRADEMVYVGRLRPARNAAPQAMPGSGVVLGVAPDSAPAGLAAELQKLATEHNVPLVAEPTGPLPRVSYTRGPELPERFAHLAVATAWPVTPAEVLDSSDVARLADLVQLYAEGRVTPLAGGLAGGPLQGVLAGQRQVAPAMSEILKTLVEAYGVSGYEGPVQEAIKELLPPWAKPELDEAGNLILRVGTGSAGPRIAFVAHSDEIGFRVEAIAADGRLEVRPLGGMLIEYFAGHAVLVHTAGGRRPGVIELPEGWDQRDFTWPRGPRARWRVDVGARTAEQAAELGIKVGNSITVPKKYRPLAGTRANGRSFDDRVGSAALVAAAWALGGPLEDRDVTFAWVTEEEVGLRGAFAMAQRLAAEGRAPDYVFPVDTFVSSDSPLETQHFAYGAIGAGFVIRAVDNSNVARREFVDRLARLARENDIPVQFGTTGGGNDGAAFLRYGATDIPIAWALRYSHSPGEVIDVRDAEALARIVAVLARTW